MAIKSNTVSENNENKGKNDNEKTWQNTKKTNSTTRKTTQKPKKKKASESLSPRQQKVIAKISETLAENGRISKGQILAEAGYSESVQISPSKVFNAASMRQALKKIGLDLSSLRSKHRQLLNAGQIQTLMISKEIPPDQFVEMFLDAMPGSRFLQYFDTMSARHYMFVVPDVIIQAKMLEMQYKILGEFAPEKHAITDTKGNDVVIYLPDNNRQ